MPTAITPRKVGWTFSPRAAALGSGCHVEQWAGQFGNCCETKAAAGFSSPKSQEPFPYRLPPPPAQGFGNGHTVEEVVLHTGDCQLYLFVILKPEHEEQLPGSSEDGKR